MDDFGFEPDEMDEDARHFAEDTDDDDYDVLADFRRQAGEEA